MAEVVLVIGCSHSPFLFTPPEMWDEIRMKRSLSAAVPRDSLDVNKTKFQRCLAAFQTLKDKIDSVKPDVMLIFGDDQLEQFHFSCMPAFGVYLGDIVKGRKRPLKYLPGDSKDKNTSAHYQASAKGHPELGKELLGGLIKRGFDLSFSLQLPDEKRGMGHAFMYPAYYLTPNYNFPILPFFINCYFPPQPTGKRCYELGRAVREVIEACPTDLKVAVIGSGGLWHLPDVVDAYLDEDFDKTILKYALNGHARQMAEYFDSFEWPYPSAGGEAAKKLLGTTGMSGGIGSGVGEVRNWIAAASVADGRTGSLVDYVPVYASPCGMGFAYWDFSQ